MLYSENIPYLTENEAKDTFTDYIDKKCCYGRSPLIELKIININSYIVNRVT